MHISDQYKNLVEKGAAALKAEDFETAIEHFQQATILRPESYSAHICLSKAYFKKGVFPKALLSFEQTTKFDPLSGDFQSIQQAIQKRDYGGAERIAQDMLKQIPGHARAIFTLSHIFARRGQHEERVACLNQGLDYAPANLVLRRLLISALEDAGDFQRAVFEAKHLVEIEASFENTWLLMGVFLRHGFNENLLEQSKSAYPLCAGDKAKISEVDFLRGQALKILGNRTEAIGSFKSCIQNKAESGAAWWALADMKDYHFSKSDKQAMKLILTAPSVSPEQKEQAAFALAKAHEIEDNYSHAMDVYETANAFRGAGAFNADRFPFAIEKLTQAFTAEVVSKQASVMPEGPIPIFILGMPRSGSTLIEQILSSHSKIEGTMELLVLPSVKRMAHKLCATEFQGSYLENMGRLSTDDLQELGQIYITQSALYRRENKPYFIDKLPNNFEHVGLIHKILPHAVIIDARRNPMDCGFSLFKQYFRAGVNYSYDLGNIGTYYNGYLNVMDRWDDILPGRVLHVQYEELVENPEKIVRDILEHVGLGFEESCLRFYENKRAVRTASSEQVRKPIYKSGLGQWRNLENRLGALKESLGTSTLQRFATYL